MKTTICFLNQSTIACLLFFVALSLVHVHSLEAQSKNRETDKVPDKKKEPEKITVQHILIGFSGSVPGKEISRSKEEAEKLAKEIFAASKKKDADFDALVKKHTDDSHPGIYSMANFDVEADPRNPDPKKRVYPRGGMVAAFGDTGFPLKVGEVGLAVFDKEKSKYGWHIIKRIK